MQTRNTGRPLSLAIAFALLISVALADEIGVTTTAPAATKTITSTARVTLNYTSAIHPNGAAYPQKDQDCAHQLANADSHYHKLKVATTYSINAATNRMSATSSFKSPDNSSSDNVAIPLMPLHFKDKFGFGAFTATHYYLFTLDKNFTNPLSAFVIINANQEFNCVISSQSDVVNLDFVKILEQPSNL